MNIDDFVKYTVDSLTGGRISVNVERGVIESHVMDALQTVRPWYIEPPLVTTVSPSLVEGRAGYIDLTTLSAPVHVVIEVLPVDLHQAGDYVLEEISNLLDLPAGLWDTESTRTYAQWTETRRQIVKALGKTLGFKKVGSKLYVDDIAWQASKVTMVWVPLPVVPEGVTYGPAIEWMKEWVEAKTKISWAGAIGKFSGGTMSFSTNSDVLRSEGREDLARLREELRTLQFSYLTFSRR